MGIKVPSVGEWFIDPRLGQKFEVIAIDDIDGGIEIEYDDGELAEIDTGTWQAMRPDPSTASRSLSAGLLHETNSYEASFSEDSFDDGLGDSLDDLF